MRIGVDARPLSYALTGIGVYLRHLLEALAGLDERNEYVLISNAPIAHAPAREGWSKVEGRCARPMASTVWMQLNGPSLARRFGLDIFWGPRHHLPVFLPARVKSVLTIHDLVHALYPRTMGWQYLAVERLLMRRSVLRADRVIAVSKSTAKDLIRLYGGPPGKVCTIYHGPPPIGAEAALPENLPRRYFLFVGTLEPRKNFLRVLGAFERLGPARREAHLVIVGGKGWKNRAFFERLHGHPLRHLIHLEGYVDSERLPAYYRNAACLVYPSLYEGFGLPILEAMACGTPVITSSVSSMPEVAGGAALLVDPFDTGGLADRMRQILSDGGLCERLAEAGRERVRHFSWETCAREVMEVFASLGETVH